MEESTSRSEDDTGEEPEDSSSTPTTLTTLSSSNRDMRNRAEKSRRDRLNQHISELAMLVPMVASSAKRLDKTSVLRLSATFLRMHQILISGRNPATDIPQLPMAINWWQKILEGMEGMLLVVTSTGKIVFISHTVESILGHQQIELLGQSLFNITSLEDHDELKRNLKPDEEQGDGPSTSSKVCRVGESSTSSGRTRSRSRPPQRRSFYLRMRQRAVSRSDQPQYELVHIVGHLRVPPPPSGRHHKTDTQVNNDIVLVALVKPFRERRITEFSLLEACKEEWITRHLLDGRIIFTDHRISVVSGYMSEEVTGMYAFRYMHKDDVQWVMIALSQMYCKSESYGSSCYRLQSKTGEYIYIQTHGYLELEEDSNSVQSFICINTLVSKEEGEKHIQRMREEYGPLLSQQAEPGMKALTNSHVSPLQEEVEPPKTFPVEEDPKKELKDEEVDEVVHHLLSYLPSNGITGVQKKTSPPDIEYKQMLESYSQSLPSAAVQSSKVGLEMTALGPSTSTSKSSPVQDRHSVLCVAEPGTNQVSVLPLDGCQATSVVVKAEKQKRNTETVDAAVKRLRPEGRSSVIVSETNSRGGVIKRRQDYRRELTVDVEGSMLSSNIDHYTQGFLLQSNPPSEMSIETTQQDNPLYTNDVSFSCLDLLAESTLGDMEGSWGADELCVRTQEELEEGVVRNQRHIASSLQYQGKQFTDIEQNLNSVPINAVGSQICRNKLTHFKAEYSKHQQELRNLQQDSMQLTMRSAHQDIGV